MIRRSFSVLLACLLLGLLMILGYAAFLQEGSADALRQAAKELSSGNAAAAVRTLGLAQRALGPGGDRALLHDLHVLRAEAHAGLRNWDKALSDIELVLDEYRDVDPGPRTHPDWPFADDWPFAGGRQEYQRRRIRYLLRAGRYDDARSAAEAYLEERPDDPLVLDLAGQALQSLYQERLAELQQQQLEVQISERMRLEVLEVAIPFLYTHENDPAVARLHAELDRRLDRILDPVTAGEIGNRLVGIRQDIAGCRRFYEAALVGPVEVPASLQGYAGILLRAHRYDEAAALAWLYLQRFPHGRSASIAARQAMEAELSLQVPELAARIGRHWLATRTAAELVGDWDHAQAFASLARALYELDARDELQDLVRTIDGVEGREHRRLGPESDWIRGLMAELQDDVETLELHLAAFCAAPSVQPRPAFGPDLYLAAMRLRREAAMRSQRYDRAEALLRDWTRTRPREPEPRLALARLLTDHAHEHRAAAKECQGVLDLPRDQQSWDEALRILLVAVDRLNEPRGTDSAGLFRQLVLQQSSLHRDLPHPILHYGIAIQAWLAGAEPILEANLARFLDAYPYSSDGFVLRAQLERLRGNPRQVAYDADRVLAGDPDHLAAGLLRLEALEAAGASSETIDAVRLDLCERHPDRIETARRIGELLLTRGAYEEARLVATAGRAAVRDPAGMAWIRGRALDALERPAEALAALRMVPAGDPHRIDALLLALSTAANQGWSHDLPALVASLEAAAPAPVQRIEAARTLVTAGRGSLALGLLEPVHRGLDDDARTARGGAFYVLCARAAAAAGNQAEARDMALRALGFADAGPAPALAVGFALCADDLEEARKLSVELRPLGAPPLLQAWIEARLDQGAEARQSLAKATLASEPLAALLRAAVARLGEPDGETRASDRCGVTVLDELAAKEPRRLCEALVLASEPALRDRAREALATLVADGAFGDDPDRAAVIRGLCEAWQRELAGDAKGATGTLAGLLDLVSKVPAAQPLFALVHAEFFRVGAPFSELLDNDTMLLHYSMLLTFLGPGPLQALDIPRRALAGTARACIEAGNDAGAKAFLQAALVLAPDDVGLLERFAEVQARLGDARGALVAREKLCARLDGEDYLEALQDMLRYLDALDRDGRLDDPELATVLRPLRNRVRDWIETPTSPGHPPLGLAAWLELRDRWDGQRDLAEDILRATLQPYIEGSLAPGLDAEGLVLLCGWLRDHGHDRAMGWIEALRELDPSIPGLWLLSAEDEIAQGEFEQAEKKLSRLAAYLPDAEVLTRLGLVRGRYGLGSPGAREELLAGLAAIPGAGSGAIAARGLLELRLGDPEACLDLLAEVEDPRLDGPRALAGILADRPDAHEVVLDLLDRWRKESRFLAAAPVLAAQIRAMDAQGSLPQAPR